MRIERMASCDSKMILSSTETLDRISELPEPIIHHILFYLPLEDSGRASILSKTWKRFCSLYPVLHFDHNLFALQSLISSKEVCGPSVDLIRDMFLDYVDYHLTRVSQSDSHSPIRKLSLIVGIDDSSVYFSRVEKWLKLIKQMNVEDLCLFVQTFDFAKAHYFVGKSLYQLPFSLLDSKRLRSVSFRGCMFGDKTFAGEVSFSSLQQLCLSHVYIGENVVEIMARCCQGIEILVLDNCTIIEALELSKFPKLKKALIEVHIGRIEYVDIVNTNLECFKCVGVTECHISRDACAGIREFTLSNSGVNHPNLFKDLTATFPHSEEIEVKLRLTDMLKAASNVLRKLKFVSWRFICVKEVHIDCPSLTLLDFSAYGLTNLYVNCPKLRVFRYDGNTIPEQLFFSSADLHKSSCNIDCDVNDTSLFIKLRLFLQLTMASSTNISLRFHAPIETFKPEELKSVQVSPQYNVNLTLDLALLSDAMQNVAALVDAVLWIIRPTTLTFDYRSYYLLKYLCENLSKKSQDKIDGEQFRHPCWLHYIEDFEIESLLDISDIKLNLASLPELCRAIGARGDHAATGNNICFKFRWCYNK